MLPKKGKSGRSIARAYYEPSTQGIVAHMKTPFLKEDKNFSIFL